MRCTRTHYTRPEPVGIVRDRKVAQRLCLVGKGLFATLFVRRKQHKQKWAKKQHGKVANEQRAKRPIAERRRSHPNLDDLSRPNRDSLRSRPNLEDSEAPSPRANFFKNCRDIRNFPKAFAKVLPRVSKIGRLDTAIFARLVRYEFPTY